MANRTTPSAVKKIIETDDTISTDLASFIETANQIVTDCCGGAGYTDAKLELIERWLSAHFYAIRDPRTSKEGAGSVNATYRSKVDLNLALTHYGQQAMLIDTEGGLAALNGRATKGKAKVTPSISWAGAVDWNTDNI